MSAAFTAKRLLRSFQQARRAKSLYQKIREYRPFVEVRYETEDFLVTTAGSGRDLLQALELRHEIFIEEWQGRREPSGLDVDEYDFRADHLIIIDKSASALVGTYRLLSSHFTHDFYSSSEFRLGRFLSGPEVKLEMGRACIRAGFRTGVTIDLLWRGLVQYILKTNTRFLFGCSSVRSTDAALVSSLYRTMAEEGRWSDEYAIRPTRDYEFPGFAAEAASVLGAAERREWMPPLLRSYLNAGAKVYGAPALDREFECVDLLTILDWRALNPRFHARFMDSSVIPAGPLDESLLNAPWKRKLLLFPRPWRGNRE
ncbi:MAG: GNAT family N-acetyltransferase [Calothrix sp. SM1_5_4]|nr:GNAT family N-acetyltransferase [Calothrix sp. SM1_5_4]